MTFVLVHGGGFDGSCWDPLVGLLDGPVHTVDLPGRGDRGSDGDVDDLTIDDFAQAVIDVITTNDLTAVILVGHSLAGITLPVVAGKVPDRLARLVFLSASVPPAGTAVREVLGSMSPLAAKIADEIGEAAISDRGTLHPDLAEAMFCNDMTPDQVSYTLDHMVSESFSVVSEPVDLSGLAQPVPRTYIRLLRDQSLLLSTQDEMIANLGGADVVDIDTSHMAMISDPVALAAVLNGLD